MEYDENNILEYMDFLGLPEKFDLIVLKKVYKKNVLKFHPDRTSDNDEKIKLENKMKKINEVYNFLKQYLNDNGGEFCSLNYKETEIKAANQEEKYSNTQKKKQSKKTMDSVDNELEVKLDNKIRGSGCLLWLTYIIIMCLNFIFENDFLFFASILCYVLLSLMGLITILVRIFRKF